MATFRLQPLLDLRRRREEQMQQRLAAATQARARAEQLLRMFETEAERRRDAITALLAGGRVDARAVQDGGLALDAAERAIEAQKQEVNKALAFEEEERGRLTAAMSERKALDRLREQHEARELAEQNRREAIVLGEIANSRAAREQMSARTR
jgi:flagellar export protein FliJ